MVHLIVDSMINIDRRNLQAKTVNKLIKLFTYKDPYYQYCKKVGIPTTGLTSKIVTWESIDNRLQFWRGSLGAIITFLKNEGLRYKVTDNRLFLKPINLACGIKLRKYQVKPSGVMIKRQQTLGRGAAGSGKTELMLKVLAHFKQPSLVLVWQERQQKTWLDRIPKYFGFKPGGIGGSFKTPVIAPITVGLVQTVGNYVDKYKNLFGAIACDECQRFAAKTLRDLVNQMPAAIRIGASDDERRRDGREFLLYDTFGPLGWSLGNTQGQCPVDIHFVPTNFNDKTLDPTWAGLITGLTKDEGRNKLIADLAEREVEDGRRVLIWSDRTDHCRMLREEFNKRGMRSGLLIGNVANRRDADKTEKGLRAGTIEIGIGTSIAEQSINIPALDRGIMTCCSAGYQPYRFRQMRGRLARKHGSKEKSILYYMWDFNIPKLRKKILNVKKHYPVVKVQLPFIKTEKGIEEKGIMTQLAPVNVKTLKMGCESLGIRIPKDVTQKKLESLIKRELQKDVTYSSICCGACQRDIVYNMSMCPYCTAKFAVFEQQTEDQQQEGEYEAQGADEGYEDDTNGDANDEGYTDDNPEDDGYEAQGADEQGDEGYVEDNPEDDGYEAQGTDGQGDDGYEAQGANDTGDDGYEDDGYEEDQGEVVEVAPPLPPQRKVKKQKSPAERQQKKDEKEHRRNEIIENAPYTLDEIKSWTRPTLAMLAKHYGLQAIGEGITNEKLVRGILTFQGKNWEGAEYGLPKKPKGTNGSKPKQRQAPQGQQRQAPQGQQRQQRRRPNQEPGQRAAAPEQEQPRRRTPKGAVKPTTRRRPPAEDAPPPQRKRKSRPRAQA